MVFALLSALLFLAVPAQAAEKVIVWDFSDVAIRQLRGVFDAACGDTTEIEAELSQCRQQCDQRVEVTCGADAPTCRLDPDDLDDLVSGGLCAPASTGDLIDDARALCTGGCVSAIGRRGALRLRCRGCPPPIGTPLE